MKSTKITKTNHAGPFKNPEDAALVRGEFFNDLMDDLAAHIPSDGEGKLDTLDEYTAGAGVIIEGIQLIDGYARHGVAIAYQIPFINQAIQQDLTTTFAGPNTAVSASVYCTAITTGAGGANALTLAAPPVVGLLKKIRMDVDAADAVITVSGGTTTSITLNDAGDYVVLLATSAGWRCIENYGCTVA